MVLTSRLSTTISEIRPLDSRDKQCIAWLEQVGYPAQGPLTPASRDASFRRYYRIPHGERSVILMDAPPPEEDAGRFVRLARRFAQRGVRVPAVLAADETRGFAVLEDFGKTQYFQALNNDNVDRLYGQALEALFVLQCGVPGRDDPMARSLPDYDRALLLNEMSLFDEWLVAAHLGLKDADRSVLYAAYGLLADVALEQPRVVVHRDFHSRNLMVLSEGGPGVLDFQDAVWGPVTYDLVSLLKDCYVAWPGDWVRAWALAYRARLAAAGLSGMEDETRFLRWFDFMGVQRHLKAAGIFARLRHRDGRDEYLKDIPLTLGYVAEVCGRYPELRALGAWLETYIQPRIPLRPPRGE